MPAMMMIDLDDDGSDGVPSPERPLLVRRPGYLPLCFVPIIMAVAQAGWFRAGLPRFKI